MAVANGRIAALGSVSDLRERFPNATEWVDLHGEHVLPGFIDAHCHFSLGAFQALWPAVPDGDYARFADSSSGGWLRFRQPPQWCTHPTLAELDQLFPHRPTITVERGYHGCALNSAARRLLADQFEEFSRWLDSDPGTLGPTTLSRLPPELATTSPASSAVYEAAMGIAEQASRSWYATHHFADVLAGIKRRAEEFLSHGITTICEAAATPDIVALLQHANANGMLPLRCSMLLSGETGLFSPASNLVTPRSDNGRLRTWGVKLFVDGGRQCLLTLPDGRTIGYQHHTPVDLITRMKYALENDYNIACHAMGNLAVRHTLDAYEQAVKETGKVTALRVEHAAILDKDSLSRLAEVGPFVVIQPGWIKWLGPFWLRNPYPNLKFLPFLSLNERLRLASSSDCTDGMITSPLEGARAAVTRRVTADSQLHPEEAVSAASALAWCTIGAAEACGVAHECGSLEEGKAADFVLLREDPRESLTRMGEPIEVDATFVDGRCKYLAPQFMARTGGARQFLIDSSY